MRTKWLLVLCLGCLARALRADDWPQFRGPHRDSLSHESGLLKEWPKGGPPLMWTYTGVGIGFSGPAVVGDRIYSMGGRGDAEYVFALDPGGDGRSVKERWAVRVGPVFTWPEGGNRWGDGPRATPTVDRDLVFALGGLGTLVCVEADTGKERWRKDLPRELGAEVNNIAGSPEKIGWGFSWSPLVDGQRVICQPGGRQGTLAALDRDTGRVLWQSKEVTYAASYSSPVAADFGGIHQYVVLTNEGLTSVRADTGKLLWHYAKQSTDIVAPAPLVLKDQVYATEAGGGCMLVSLTRQGEKLKPVKVFSNSNMVNVHGGVLALAGHVYGYSEGKGWACQDLKKPGRLTWSEKRALGRGSLTAVEDRLYCYGENDGTVVLAGADPSGWKEYGRFTIPQKSTRRPASAKIWTYPVVANGRLYLRDQELLFCFDVRPQPGHAPGGSPAGR